MEDQSTSEAQQEVIQPKDCSSTAPQSHHSEQQHDPSPSPSSATPSSSSAVTDSSSSPACEDVGAGEDSVSVAASHRDAAPEPQLPMDAAQPGNMEAQKPQTDTENPGVVMEGTGDTVDTGQEPVPHTKQEDTGEVEEALKLEGGGDQVPLEQEALEKTPELELEENGNGVESLDFMNVSILDDMAKRIQVEEVGDRFSVKDTY
ncbi:hypothetical protein M9458_034401, partial [Cirrhinus mrigala]